MTRRFEFIAGNSAKFWEVTTAGSEVTVRYGRLGSSGQSQTTVFADDNKAQNHTDKLIREKLGKGYHEAAAV